MTTDSQYSHGQLSPAERHDMQSHSSTEKSELRKAHQNHDLSRGVFEFLHMEPCGGQRNKDTIHHGYHAKQYKNAIEVCGLCCRRTRNNTHTFTVRMQVELMLRTGNTITFRLTLKFRAPSPFYVHLTGHGGHVQNQVPN